MFVLSIEIYNICNFQEIVRTCEYITLHSSGVLTDVIKVFEVRLSWVIQWVPPHATIRALIGGRQEAHREGNVITETERGWSESRKRPEPRTAGGF